jgi:hypothetical protein
MIFPVAAFLVSAVELPAPGALDASSLPNVFVAACVDGQVRLSASEATSVSFGDLPADLRQRLGSPSSGEVWQLSAPGRAYLYVLDYESAPGVDPKICGLASDTMDLNAAADAVEVRVTGSIRPNRLRGTEWLQPHGGYVAIATTAAEYNVVQVNWLSESQRAATLDYVRAAKH